MLDLARIEGFEWDAGNARKSENKHGVAQTEAEQVFANEPLLVKEDLVHSQNEQRWQALGKTHGNRLLHVTYTLRDNGKLIRVISARDMNRKERAFYGQGA